MGEDQAESDNLINSSKYFEIPELVELTKKMAYENHLSIFNTNSRSLLKNKANYDLLFEYLKCNSNFQFDILTFDETWLNSDLEELVTFGGYSKLTKNKKPKKEGGGLAIFVNNDIDFKQRTDIEIPPSLHNLFDCLFIEVSCNGEQLIIGLLYRSPSHDSVAEMNTFLSGVIGKLQSERKTIILLGDLNINLLKASSSIITAAYLDQMLSNNLFPVITLPTRVTSHSATLIDHIFTNADLNKLTAGTLKTDITDHFSNFIVLNTTKQNSRNKNPSHVSYRPVTDTAIANFNHALAEADWSSVYSSDDPSEAYSKFISLYRECLNLCIPVKTCRFHKYKHKQHPWISKGLLTSLKTKDRLYSDFQKCTNLDLRPRLEEKYKKYRNVYNRLIRSAKTLHWCKIFENCKNDMQRTWSNINCLLNKKDKKCNSPDHMLIEGKVIHDSSIIANKFNNYFVNVGPMLAQSIDDSGLDSIKLPSLNLPHSFSLTPVSPVEIKLIIDKMKPKTSKGIDEISPKLVKTSELIIAEILSFIANLSFKCGKFPADMKIAKVVPVYKSKDSSLISNYRPISLLPAFSKIFERLVYNRLYKYLKTNKIITASQFGFQKGISTDLAILDLQNYVVESLRTNKWCIGVFLDLSKAFDTLDHKILLQKLFRYGIRGVSLDWFRSYLTDRLQYTEFRSESSQQQLLTCGVPQGSILGPLLFLLYINDIVHLCNSCKPILFADDTNLIFNHTDLNELVNNVNRELQTLSSWFKVNKLSLNSDKTKVILFQSQSRALPDNTSQSIYLEGQKIEQVSVQKFLGVYIDQLLNWRHHISLKNNIISRNVGILSRLKNTVPPNILKTLYHSIILPHLSYGVVAWGGTCKKELNRMSVLQRKAIRLIHLSKYNAHTGPLFRKLNALMVHDIYKLQCCKLVLKKQQNQLHPNISRLFSPSCNLHSHNTRQASNIRPPRKNKTLCKQLLSSKIANNWNNLPNTIKSNTNLSLSTFSTRTKTYFISKYPASCSLINCYVCSNNN